MTRRLFPLLTLLAAALLLQPALPPALAQDGEDEDDGLEIGCGEGGDPVEDDEWEETRKKNAGLAGGGKKDDSDPNAPKVKMNLQQRINLGIKNGVDWLKQAQLDNGSWGVVTTNSIYGKPEITDHEGQRDELGPTAWALYTLAKCGVSRKDPVFRKGMKYLNAETKYVFDVMGGTAAKRNDLKAGLEEVTRNRPRSLTTYESAALVMMIEATYESSAKLTGKHRKRRLYSDNPLKPPSRSKIPKKVWKFMHDRIIHLTVGRRGGGGGRGRGGGRNIPGTQNMQGSNLGGWRYGQANGDADLSATQFVLLALRAASQAGYPVSKTSKKVWRDAAAYVMSLQRPDGGFPYQHGNPKATGSMTACGIACLVICKEQIELDEQTPPNGIDKAIKDGLAWLDQNFTPQQNPPSGSHHYYYLYGVERVGDLTGRSEFNKLNWYVRGANLLLANQGADGVFLDSTAFTPRPVVGTCFALLFLKRATIPTVTVSGS